MLVRRAGYFMQDNRVSGGGLFESDVKTCAHCMTQIIMNPLRQRERHHCKKCDTYICDNPACHFECSPYVKRLDINHEKAMKATNLRTI